jgi:zinc protease
MRISHLALTLVGTALIAACAGPEADAPMPTKLTVDADYYSLANGLKVVLSRDTTVPTVGVGVYYHVGFRK